MSLERICCQLNKPLLWAWIKYRAVCLLTEGLRIVRCQSCTVPACLWRRQLTHWLLVARACLLRVDRSSRGHTAVGSALHGCMDVACNALTVGVGLFRRFGRTCYLYLHGDWIFFRWMLKWLVGGYVLDVIGIVANQSWRTGRGNNIVSVKDISHLLLPWLRLANIHQHSYLSYAVPTPSLFSIHLNKIQSHWR